MDESLRLELIRILRNVDDLVHHVDFHADWTGYFEIGDPLDALLELRGMAERIHAGLHIILTMLERGDGRAED